MAFVTTGPGELYIATTTASGQAWASWNQFYVSTGTGNWTSTTIGSTVLADTQWVSWNTVVQETAGQAAERQAREEQWRQRDQEYQELRQLASERSEELLLLMLSDEQAASRRDHGWFAVRGSRSGRTYRIHSRGYSNNVDRLGADGHRETIFCAHPVGVPAADAHLAQMLALVTDEDAFLRVANSHPAPLAPAPVLAAA